MPTTNYKVKVNGEFTDLNDIFESGTTPTETGFKVNNNDLCTMFAPLSAGEIISYNTGFIAKNLLDLRYIFCAKNPFTATGNYTFTKNSNKYYTVVFAKNDNTSSSGTITFNKALTNVQVVCVGGGAGGAKNTFTSDRYGLGGGSGGRIIQNTISISANSAFNITVGAGGISTDSNYIRTGGGGTTVPATRGGTTSVTNNAAGINYEALGGYSNGLFVETSNYFALEGGPGLGGSNVGKGGPRNFDVNGSYDGFDGQELTLLNNESYWFSGGGARGTGYKVKDGTGQWQTGDYSHPTPGDGKGGKGGGGGYGGSNFNTTYTGPNGTSFPSTGDKVNGIPSSGGGGAGQSYQKNFASKLPTGCGIGGSGIVIFCFQYNS